MALSAEDRRILSQAREIIFREAMLRNHILGSLAATQDWASRIAASSEDLAACEAASIACGLASARAEVISREDRHSHDAIAHIDDLIGLRDA